MSKVLDIISATANLIVSIFDLIFSAGYLVIAIPLLLCVVYFLSIWIFGLIRYEIPDIVRRIISKLKRK